MAIHTSCSSNKFRSLAFLVGILSVFATPAWSVEITEAAKLLAADGAAGDVFGFAYAMDGDTAILGANHDDDDGGSSGSAYVYVRNTAGVPCPETSLVDPWCQQAKLTAGDGEGGDWFGYGVAVSGDTVAVSARRDDNGTGVFRAGSVYIFERSGTVWTQTDKFQADDLTSDPQFGFHVALEADTLVVGARTYRETSSKTGAVYVFTRTAGSWSQQARLLASDGAAGDLFGTFVSLDGNTLAIGAHGNDDDGSNSGSAYIFVRDGSSWSEQAKLTASDAAVGDLFGQRLSLSGNKVLIAASAFMTGRVGAVYVFNEVSDVWTEEAKLTASDGFAGDGYGFTMGLSGNIALVGANNDDDFGVESGSAYMYVRTPTGWSEDAKFHASDAGAVGWFGSGFQFSGDTVVIAATPLFDFTKNGAAYVFEIDRDDDGIRDGLDNCPIDPNPGQSDSNSNGVGDICDIGATQTYSDGGTPTLEDAIEGGCVDCVANGWAIGEGDIVEGEIGPGDNAVLYDTGGGNFHFLTWRLYKYDDRRFLGDLEAANVAGIRFRAKHGGGAENIVLKALMADPFDDNGSDFAISNTSVTIPMLSGWETYDISLIGSNLTLGTLLFDPFGFVPARRTASEIRSNVAQFGLRHTPPGNMGPGDPAPTSSTIQIDDIQLIIDLDYDDDGIANNIDADPLDFMAADFSDGTTFGMVKSKGAQSDMLITDEPDPDGVRIAAPLNGGLDAATVNVCGVADLSIDAGDDLVVTCGSVEIVVIVGEIDMVVEVNGEPAIVSVPAGNEVTFVPETPTEPATFITPPENTAPVIVEIGGAVVSIKPGQTSVVAAFDNIFAEVEIEDDEVEFEGGFTLGSDSDGIDPLAEDVTVAVGTFETTIPAGYLSTKNGKKFKFKGRVGGVKLEVKIKARRDGSFRIEFEAEADLSGTTNPVEVRLTIGDDAGSVSVNAEIDDDGDTD